MQLPMEFNVEYRAYLREIAGSGGSPGRYPDEANVRLLVRTLGALEDGRGGGPVTDVRSLASAAEVELCALARLLAAAVHAGWIAENADGALRLTAAGRRRWLGDGVRRGDGR